LTFFKFAFVFLVLVASSTSQAEVVERILAIVNHDIITQTDLRKYRDKLHAGGIADDLLGGDEKTLLNDDKALLKRMIDEKVIEGEVKRQNLQVTIEQVEKEINSIQARNGINREQLRQALKTEGTTFSEYQDFIRKRLERQAIIEKNITSRIKISDDDVRAAYYNTRGGANGGGGQVFEYKIAHILFRRGPPEEIERKAQEVLRKLKTGESFEQLSMQYSEDPNYNEGGFLGSFKQGEFLKPLEDAVSHINVGEYAGPIKTKIGIHIVKLLDRKAVADPEFEKKKEEVRNQLYQRAFTKQFQFWLEQRRQEAFIRLNYPS